MLAEADPRAAIVGEYLGIPIAGVIMRIVEADLEIRRIFLFEGFHPEGSASLAAWFLEAGRGGFGLRRRRFSKNSFKASTHLFIIIAFKLHQREPVLLTPSPSLLSPFPPLSKSFF